jgi:Fe-S cluster biogenesis protein NfuA
MPVQPEFQQRLGSIERLLSEIESAADPALRTSVRELVQLVMDLHGAGLERIIELTGEDAMGKLGRDDLVASLLILHGLHPLSLEARVTQAAGKARSRLRAHEGDVEVLSVRDGEVRLRIQANGHGCGSGAEALREIVENAVYESAPDVTSLIIESAGARNDFVPLEMLQGAL